MEYPTYNDADKSSCQVSGPVTSTSRSTWQPSLQSHMARWWVKKLQEARLPRVRKLPEDGSSESWRVPAKCPEPSPELVGHHNSLRTEVELSGGAGSESPRADPNRRGHLRLVPLRDPLGVSGG